MIYPYSIGYALGDAKTQRFGGINRTENGSEGEWQDAHNLDTEHFPCIAPRYGDGGLISTAYTDTSGGEGDTIPSSALIAVCASPVKDDGTYHGFTGVVLMEGALDGDGAAQVNFCFAYNGRLCKVGTLNGKSPVRTALWIYDPEFDGVTPEEISAFNGALANRDTKRVSWSAVTFGSRIVINGYDNVLKRGRYFCFEADSEDAPYVIESSAQTEQTGVTIYRSSAVKGGAEEYVYMNTISSTKCDFREYFTEGDYLLIRVLAGSADESRFKNYEIFPLTKDKRTTKYAVIREIVNNYDSDGDLTKSTIYYYSTLPDGGYVSNKTELRNAKVVLGTYVPAMNHISVYGSRIWGCDPEEGCVYASVYDTPFKVMNTDAQLDAAMSWQTVPCGADRLTGMFPAGSELIAFKRNSLVRINGASASSFGITGVFSNCGCIDIRSAAECAGVVFYLGSSGFYAYDGSQPMIISAALGCRYKAAVGFCDGNKYYASAIRADGGGHEFLVYDTRYRTWHKWDDIPECKGIFRIGDMIMLAADTAAGGSVRELCTSGKAEKWSCVSVRHFEDINGFKGVNELWIRAKIDSGDTIKIYTSVNGGEWRGHKTLDAKGRIFIYKLPVRFDPGDFWQYRLEGSGGAVVYNISRVYDDKGKRHYN